MRKYHWQQERGSWICTMPGNITLWASPVDYARGFIPKPARGTKWRAGCNHWNEAASTLSRYGRDAYMDTQDSAKAAMRLAESIYEAAQQSAA